MIFSSSVRRANLQKRFSDRLLFPAKSIWTTISCMQKLWTNRSESKILIRFRLRFFCYPPTLNFLLLLDLSTSIELNSSLLYCYPTSPTYFHITKYPKEKNNKNMANPQPMSLDVPCLLSLLEARANLLRMQMIKDAVTVQGIIQDTFLR